MKLISVVAIFVCSVSVFAQSGRRSNPVALTIPSPSPTPVNSPAKQSTTGESPSVTAEKNQDYRCTNDGTLVRILDTQSGSDKGFLPKEVDTPAAVTSKPAPRYTQEARHAGVQGYVALKVLLAAKGEIDRVRVLRRLPFGLTETAIQAACEIKFKPAIKDGLPVAEWLIVEYTFRLTSSSILRP